MRSSWKTVVAAAVLAVPSLAWANSGRVLVQPFSEASDQAMPGPPSSVQHQPDWINRALTQSVSDDLAGIKGLTVVSSSNTPADYVVSGTIQRLNGDLRVTGRVEDTSTHQIVGGFKATGAERDLFAVEDSISAQLKQIIAPQAPPIGYAQGPATQPTLNNPFAPPPGSTYQGSDLQRALEERDYLRRLAASTPQYQPPPDYTYNQPVYPADYGYGYNYPPYSWGYGYGYPYGYWWGGGSVVIINDRNNHHHGDGGHHWDGHGWNRGDSGGFVANPGGSPTQSLSDNGQRIRAASSFGGAQNAPPGLITTPTSSPQLVPTRGIQLTPNTSPQMVPTRGPQLVPSGGPQMVPSGGPQNVVGPAGGGRR